MGTMNNIHVNIASSFLAKILHILKFEKFQSKMKKSNLHLHQVFQEGPLVSCTSGPNKWSKEVRIFTFIPHISINDTIQNTVETIKISERENNFINILKFTLYLSDYVLKGKKFNFTDAHILALSADHIQSLWI